MPTSPLRVRSTRSATELAFRLRARRAGLDFLDLKTADALDHVMVDGRTREKSVLTLSHWANVASPRRYRRDTSTEMCLAYLARHRRLPKAAGVTSDHLDEDGLCSLAVFVDPAGAFDRAERLEALALAGDFSRVRDEHAAKLSFVAAAMLDAARSPFLADGRD